MLICS